MKPFLKLCLLACITLFSVACSNSVKLTGNEFLIEGKISGIEDGIVINLSKIDVSGFPSYVASDTIKDGRFKFRCEAETNNENFAIFPQGADFTSSRLSIWAAPKAKIKIRGNGKVHPLWEVKSYVPYQKEQNRYTNANRDIIPEQAHISIEERATWAKVWAAASDDEAIAHRKIIDSLIVVRNALMVKETYNNISILENTDITSIWLARMNSFALTVYNPGGMFKLDAEQADYLRKKAEELYGRMSEEDKNSYWGNYITAYLFLPIRPVADVGDYFADVDLLDANGNKKRTADYLGKYILIDFWASWCHACIKALPEMKEISETYSSKLTIISISFDADALWKESMVTHDLPWVNLRDPKNMNGLAAAYGVIGIPNYVMISPEGIIVDKWAGYAKGLLKQKVSENIESHKYTK